MSHHWRREPALEEIGGEKVKGRFEQLSSIRHLFHLANMQVPVKEETSIFAVTETLFLDQLISPPPPPPQICCNVHVRGSEEV